MKGKRMVLVGVFLVFAVLVLPATLIAAPAPYYQGKVINLIVGYQAGGGNDIVARVMSKHLPKHIPGNPAVVVQNMDGASGVIAANMAYGVRQGTEIVKGSDTLYPLANNQRVASHVDGDPYTKSATATSGIWSFVNTADSAGAFSQKTNEDFQPVAFKMGVTELPFWLSGTSQTNKSTANSMSYAWVNWTKVALEAKTDASTKHTEAHPFRIWELR